jgi:hypothetical protein
LVMPNRGDAECVARCPRVVTPNARDANAR